MGDAQPKPVKRILTALGFIVLATTSVRADEPSGFRIDFASKGERTNVMEEGPPPGKSEAKKQSKPAALPSGKQTNTAWSAAPKAPSASRGRCKPGPVPCKTHPVSH